jgi:hypothetical protein
MISLYEGSIPGLTSNFKVQSFDPLEDKYSSYKVPLEQWKYDRVKYRAHVKEDGVWSTARRDRKYLYFFLNWKGEVVKEIQTEYYDPPTLYRFFDDKIFEFRRGEVRLLKY